MMATLPVHDHLKNFHLDNRRLKTETRGKKASENGRKGRLAAKMITPVHLKGSAKIPVFKKLRFGR